MALVPMALSSFLYSILSPSVFGNTCLRVASGDWGLFTEDHQILAKCGDLSVTGMTGNTEKK